MMERLDGQRGGVQSQSPQVWKKSYQPLVAAVPIYSVWLRGLDQYTTSPNTGEVAVLVRAGPISSEQRRTVIRSTSLNDCDWRKGLEICFQLGEAL